MNLAAAIDRNRRRQTELRQEYRAECDARLAQHEADSTSIGLFLPTFSEWLRARGASLKRPKKGK